MNLKNKNILLISPEPWDHIFVSKHHYATHLARMGNRVFFLDPPTLRESVKETEQENVLLVTYRGFPRGMRFFPGIYQRYFIRRKFEHLQVLCDSFFDIVWSFDNSVFFDFSALPEKVFKISHIVDLNQDFQFAAASRTADICLGVSAEIVKKQRIHNSNSHFINHGFAAGFFSTDYTNLPPDSVSTRVGYAGNLDLKYIDWTLIQNIIRENKDIDFFFMGPFSTSTSYAQWLKAQSNVYLLGKIPSDQILTYYARMDLLILCYLSDDFSDQLTNPHKMMEYLGSGKMIVATYTAEYLELADRNLLLMCHSNGEFSDKFRQALSHLDFWNDEARRQERRAWALDNTYDKQLRRIENLINQQ